MSLPPPAPDASPQPALLKEVTRASANIVESMFRDAPIALAGDVSVLIRALAATNPERLRSTQERYYADHARLWQETFAEGREASAAEKDPRFEGQEWRLPYFHYLQQAYLLNARYLRDLGEIAELGAHEKRRLQYQLRQVADALSPSNHPATNPEVIKLAAESGGESLALGMKLLAGDVARGRISMTDEQAFEVGRNLAVTPGAVVFENDVMQLIQYQAQSETVFERPLLIVPPFINKYYILDLQPENSFVRFCVEQGFTTFIVSWRNVPAELGGLGWDDYIEQGVLAPMRAIRDITGAGALNALGFCVGGTLLASALAVLAARGENNVASLTLLATLLDFTETGDISVYVDPEFVERTEAEFAQPAAMSGAKLASTFAMLRANDLVWHFVVNSYLKGRAPRAFDLLYWNADGANLPGRLYAWYLRNMYLENNLRIPGRLEACGAKLDLGAIDAPALVVATHDDHIVPWKSAYESVALLGGRTEFVLGASGHVAGIVNPASKNRRHYWTGTGSGVGADAWLAAATRHPGSWWTHWAAWLVPHSGGRVAAPDATGSAAYPPIEAAPGRYVKEKF